MSKETDINLIVPTKIGEVDVQFYDADNSIFRMYGMWRDGDKYCRIPHDVAERIGTGITRSRFSTSGGRIRFVTDSSFVAVKINYANPARNDVTPSSSSMAINMYVDGEFGGVFRLPDNFAELEYSGIQNLKTDGDHLVTLFMPTHSYIEKLEIGIEPGKSIKPAPDHKYERPVVFYGSSITQGTGSSRSGMTYPAQISRRLDMNYTNLGFGGLARGEAPMAEYIATLDMALFVYDYDFNATTACLDATHEPFFKIVRKSNPDLPIIMISRPSTFRTGDDDTAARYAIIKRTYDNAVANGDKNVYLLNGLEFFGELKCECLVDGVHPSDFGYYMMTNTIAPLIKTILDK